jgi:hypothetical protein
MKSGRAVIVNQEILDAFKYAPKKSAVCNSYGKPRKMFPSNWVSGPDFLQHEIYYAWHKHRSQAKYRNEVYDLTWEDWQEIWSNTDLFLRRGRKSTDLTLTRIDDDGAWSMDNIQIMTRLEQLQKARLRTQQQRQGE